MRALVTLHGWLLLNGKVLDVTWCLQKSIGRGPYPMVVFGRWNDVRAYFGVTFSRDVVTDFVRSRRAMGSLIDDVRGGFPLLK